MKFFWHRKKLILLTGKHKITPRLQIFLALSLLINSGCIHLCVKKVSESKPTPKDTAVLTQPVLATDFKSKTKNVKPENLFTALVYSHRAQANFLKEEYEKSWEDVQYAQGLGYQFDSKFLEALKQVPEEER
jgi:hypothetical protein